MLVKSWVLFVSQFGEIVDMLVVLYYVCDKVVKIVGIVNVGILVIVCDVDIVLLMLVGIEVSVVLFKVFICQLVVFVVLVLKVVYDCGWLDDVGLVVYLDDLCVILGLVNQMLVVGDGCCNLVGWLVEVQDVLYLGWGVLYLVVLEGVLKLKELSYIYVEGYVLGELKYGFIVLIDCNVLVVVLVLCDDFFEKIVLNM